MLFSYNWLKEYLKLPKPEKLAEVLTMHAFEVEEVKKVGGDFYLDIAVLANRGPDCFSHIGIARECAAILNKKLKVADVKFKEDKKLKSKDFLKIEIENKDDCLRYAVRVIDGVKIGPSPKYIQERLKTCGLRPINNVVDATNYVMLETGQPLHAFDFNKIRGRKIVVRKAKKGEKIITLSDEKRELSNDILVIADAESPLAIAGIKGGKKAEIDRKTKMIVLESANFDSALIRKSSQKVNLRTDASLRFEHKIDPALTRQAIDRAAELISQTAKGKIAQGALDINFSKPKKARVRLELNRVESLLGVKISAEEIKSILERLYFKCSRFNSIFIEAEVPSFRLDVSLPEDLIEEIGRIKGYENIPSVFPTGYLSLPKENFEVFWQNKAKDILKELGFLETYNYSFISKRDADVFGFDNLVELENPASLDYQYLRPSLVPNLLKNVLSNFRFSNQVKLFELGKIFLKKEKSMLSGIIALNLRERKRDLFYRLKGSVDDLINKMGISNVWYDDFQQVPEESQIEMWNKNRSAEIKINGRKIGFLGEISPVILEKLKIKGADVAVFDINFEKLRKLASEEREYQPVSQYPAAVRDIAVLVPYNVKVVEVMNKINTAGGKLIVDIDLFDIYEGGNLPEGKKNLAFHITFQSENKTLSAEEIGNLQNKIIKALEENPAWEVRK